MHNSNGGDQQEGEADSAPLKGLTIVDWTHVLAGPFASYVLGLLGARVIRIEQVDAVDIIRADSADPDRASFEMGDAFVMQSAGKESISVDARDPTIARVLSELLGRVDVLVENFRPGKLAELGFAPLALIDRYPRLIVCSISGFGQSGPDAHRPAYDHVIQAMSGLMSANADTQGRPQRVGVPLIDYATGLQAAIAILAAVQRRNRQGLSGDVRPRGEWLDVSMHDAALTLLAPAYASHAVSGVDRVRSRATAFSGNPLSGTFATTDGFLAIVCNTPKQSHAFLAALRAAGIPEAEVDALAGSAEARDVERVHNGLGSILGRRSADEWEACLVRHEVPVAQVRTPAQAYAAASTDASAWPRVAVAGLSGREVAVPGPGFSSTDRLTPPLRPPPLRGEHSYEVLRSLGLDDNLIGSLCGQGAVRAATREPTQEAPVIPGRR